MSRSQRRATGLGTAVTSARAESKDPYRRNRYTFGIGTIGRDMLYTLISMFLVVYLTTDAGLTTSQLAWVTGVIVALRVFDAVNDPVMGLVVDSTRSRWGKHKPWILVGALASGLLTLAIFAHLPFGGAAYVWVMGVIFLLWASTYSLNDIAYWSYVPALTKDLRERENIGSKARMFSLVGTFFVVAANVPIRNMLACAVGGSVVTASCPAGSNPQAGWFWFAAIVVLVMWLGQAVTLLGVREPADVTDPAERTSMREFARAIFKNDQLLYVSVSMMLFMIGYTTTTSFGLFYFQYVYGDEAMFSVFAVILGVSQILSLLIFPKVAKKLPRRHIYLISTALVIVGYILFFFSPAGTMASIGVAGVLIFVGQAAIQLIMLLCLADTVDYGHWKLGKRNDSVTFSLQPFIYKAGGAVATGIVGFTAIVTGINTIPDGQAYTLSGSNLMIFKLAMLALPLVCIVVGYLIYHRKYTITEARYMQIHQELVDRGQLAATPHTSVKDET